MAHAYPCTYECVQVARAVRRSMGGSSGVLYDIMLTAAARSLQVRGAPAGQL